MFLHCARRARSTCGVCDFLIADNLLPTFGHIHAAQYAPSLSQGWEADLAKGNQQKICDDDLVDGRFAPVIECQCKYAYEFGALRSFAHFSNDGR